MQPIINPWLFYLIDVLDSMKIVIWILLIIAVIGGAVLIGKYCYNLEYDEPEEPHMLAMYKWVKRCIIITTISIIFILFIPAKKTSYTMLIMDNITPNNITAAGEPITDTVDYIVDKVDQLLSDAAEQEE